MTDYEKLLKLKRHIDHVQENCMIMAESLIDNGEFDLALNLIVNGQIHDLSKFRGIEFEHLWADEPDHKSFELAVKQHNTTNRHHPESWGGIDKMPRVYLGELVCDWKARSQEFGTSLMEYVDGAAMKRYGYIKEDRVYKELVYFANMLCEKPFTHVK